MSVRFASSSIGLAGGAADAAGGGAVRDAVRGDGAVELAGCCVAAAEGRGPAGAGARRAVARDGAPVRGAGTRGAGTRGAVGDASAAGAGAVAGATALRVVAGAEAALLATGPATLLPPHAASVGANTASSSRRTRAGGVFKATRPAYTGFGCVGD